jgi:RimJ/RimL family protein N-acetyltransferase
LQLCKWLTWCRPNHSLADCAAFILKSQTDWETGEQFNFGIFNPENSTLLGSVALNHLNRTHNFANVGYWVRSSNIGRGIATASVRLIAKFAFQNLGLTRLEIVVPVGNTPSERTAIKAGTSIEGTLRHRLMLSGKLHNATLYSLLPSDLSEPAPAAQKAQS